MDRSKGDDSLDPPGGLRSTIELLQNASGGDAAALQRLYARYVPRLRRWARGRLPGSTRSLLDTDDVVHEVLTKCVQRLQSTDLAKVGAFHSYLRVALNNRICDEIRHAQRAPKFTAMPEDLHAQGLSPIEEVLGLERTARYEAALDRLRPEDREAVVARIEMGCSFEEIASLLGKATTNAARMAVVRAMERLIREISRDS